MPAAARVSPRSYFSPEDWASLSRASPWKGAALVAHAWGVILATGAAALAWPLLIPIAVMVIGGRQLGLAILMHDAAHGALHPNLKVNDILGDRLTQGGLLSYRRYHMAHHKFAQQSEDPDLILSAPFPVTRTSLRRKILRDLTGRTYWKQQWAPVVQAIRNRGEAPLGPILREVLRRKRRFLIGLTVTVAATAPFGFWWAWPALWLLPQATWLPMVTRLRNIAEHANVAQGEPDPLRHARTTHASPIERALLAPYWVNYHCEHHMFMAVPCYNLPRVHGRLKAQGVTRKMLTAPSYLDVLAQASSRPATA
jgi:fatty acid desaturase